MSSSAFGAFGRTERELQVTLERRSSGTAATSSRSRRSSRRATVLDFSPTARELRDGDLLLVDAGAEHRGYASEDDLDNGRLKLLIGFALEPAEFAVVGIERPVARVITDDSLVRVLLATRRSVETVMLRTHPPLDWPRFE